MENRVVAEKTYRPRSILISFRYRDWNFRSMRRCTR